MFGCYKANVSHELITATLSDHCRRKDWSIVRITLNTQSRRKPWERYVASQCFHVTFVIIVTARAALAHFAVSETAAHFLQWSAADTGHVVEPSVDIHRNRPHFGAETRHVDRYWGEAWWDVQKKAVHAQEAQNHTRRPSTPHPYARRRYAKAYSSNNRAAQLCPWFVI